MPSANDAKPTSEASWLFKRFLAKEAIDYHYKSGGWIQQRDGRAPRLLTWEALDHLIIDGAASKISSDMRRRQASMYLYAMYEQELYRDRVAQQIEGWPTDDGKALDRWMDAVCREGVELSSVVVRHWLWCVRRRLLGLPIRDHICPILYGATGSGKSVEARKLFAVLDDLTSEQSLDQICDERHTVELARHYIVYIDEMAGADRAELSRLKSLITQDYANSRIMYTQRRQQTPMAASFFGSSNKPVVDVIRDKTSARRYWELRTHDRLDWPALDSIDRRLLWTAVDPQLDSPYLGAVRDEIQQLQHRKLRLRPAPELWWDELDLAVGCTPVPMADVWASYKEFCSKNGYMYGNRDQLSRWLSNVGCDAKRTKSARCRCFSADSAVILTSAS